MGIIKGVYSERCHIYFYCCIPVSAFYMHQYSYITVEEFICFSINWTTVYWPDLSRISDRDSVEHRRIWSVYGGSHIRTNRYLTENVSECQDFETRFVLHSDKYINLELILIFCRLSSTKTNSLQYVVTYDSHQNPIATISKWLECQIPRRGNRDF